MKFNKTGSFFPNYVHFCTPGLVQWSCDPDSVPGFVLSMEYLEKYGIQVSVFQGHE